MQGINRIQYFTAAGHEPQTQHASKASGGYSVYLLCLLHLAILVTAGYFITQRDLSTSTKLVSLAIACFTSVWLLYYQFLPSFFRLK